MSSKKHILLVAKDEQLTDALNASLLVTGLQLRVHTSCTDAFLDVAGNKPTSLLIIDASLNQDEYCALIRNLRLLKPTLPILMVSDYNMVPCATAAIKAGANDYVLKPFDTCHLSEVVNTLLSVTKPAADLIMADPKSKQVVELAKRVAESNATVMISGESGTGKEVFARFIHDSSPRSAKPFIAINCAAIPETMLESILFGYEKGAFTGALASKPGKFEQANGGSLLLDEISEMDLGLQAKLLRVIQEKEVERLGSNKITPLDVRIIATTNRNLKQEVVEGRFREDLFYRLNVFPLPLPSLNSRKGDILPLADKFIELYQSSPDHHLDESARKVLMIHDWQGNVRELENVIQRALILANEKVIGSSSILFEEAYTDEQCLMETPEIKAEKNLDNDLKTLEKEIIINAVHSNHNRKEAAAKLGISQRTLRYKLAQFRKEGIAIPA